MPPARILVIRFSSIGDIVLTSPVIRCLKQQTGAEIHYLIKPAFASLMKHNPYVDRIICLQPSFRETMKLLKNNEYDRVIDLHKSLRSWRVRYNLGVRAHSFPKFNIRKWLHVTFKWDVLPEHVHIVDRMFRGIRSLGVEHDGKGLDQFLPADKQFHRNIRNMLERDVPVWKEGPNPFVVFAIGAAHATKQLPVDQAIEVCNHMDVPVILLGGPSDRSAGNSIAEKSEHTVYNACGLWTLLESAAVVRLADVVLTHDTGMMHIAAAFQKPVVAIWGNTIPAFGMYPYYGTSPSKHVNIEREDLSCRPCSKIGYESCPKGHFKCMKDHDTVRIAETANSLLENELSTQSF